MTDEYDLTRRKALVGLGTIGAAGAGAGLGTSAYFSDEELFEDNNLEAGELDLYVHYEFTADQDGLEDENLADPTSGTVQGDTDEVDGDDVSIEYDLEDVKPGDSGSLEFCFSLVDNPAYLWAGGELTANDENGRTEPEAEVDDTGGDPGEGDGELADAVQATLGYCDDEGGIDDGDEITSGSLADVLGELAGGIALDGGGDVESEPGDQEPFEGGNSSAEPTDDTCLCLEWEVPTDVGNEIQTDSVAFDLSFYAEQSRHNDGTNNPFCTDLSLDLEEQYEQLLNTTLPDPYVLEIRVEDENGDPFTGEITGDDHGNDEFVWVTDHLGTFDETPENRYGAYVELDFDDDGTARILLGNDEDADVPYLGLDVNDVTENIEVNVGEVIEGLEVANMCVLTGSS